MNEPLSPEASHSPEYNRGWADGNASALDACNPIIDRLQADLSARRASDAQVAGLEALIAAVEAACPVCGGEGWTVQADPLPSGEPGEPYQVPCWDAEHSVILGRADEPAATPAPQPATPPLDGLRSAITRYLAFDGSVGMFDAMALGDAREELQRLIPLGDVTDVQNRWHARLAEPREAER